jgi:hypothetical protein
MAKIRLLEEQAKAKEGQALELPHTRKRSVSSASKTGRQWANKPDLVTGSKDKAKSRDGPEQGASSSLEPSLSSIASTPSTRAQELSMQH